MPADRIRKFMDRYGKTGSLRAAARAAKISLSAHYEMLETSDSYRKQFEAAQQQVADLLEAECFRRAFAGSDELLLFLLRSWLPQYREHTMVEHSGTVTLADIAAPDAREAVRRLIAIPREEVQ